MNPFHVGDLAYCIHSRGWGEILEFRAEYRAIALAPTCGKSKRKRFEKAITFSAVGRSRDWEVSVIGRLGGRSR
jgi:hypothetical protein